MSTIITRRFTQVSASLLTAGALLLPTLSIANATAPNAAPTAIAMNAETQPSTEFRKINKMLQPLNLSTEQQTAVKVAIDAKKEQAAALHVQMKENKEAIKAQQFSDSYNAGTVKQLADKQGSLVTQMIVLRSTLNQEVYQILTPEQKTQLQALQAEKTARKAEKRAAKSERLVN